MVSDLCWSLIYFKLIFVYTVRDSGPASFFFIWLPNFPYTIYWRYCPFTANGDLLFLSYLLHFLCSSVGIRLWGRISEYFLNVCAMRGVCQGTSLPSVFCSSRGQGWLVKPPLAAWSPQSSCRRRRRVSTPLGSSLLSPFLFLLFLTLKCSRKKELLPFMIAWM